MTLHVPSAANDPVGSDIMFLQEAFTGLCASGLAHPLSAASQEPEALRSHVQLERGKADALQNLHL